MVKHSLMVIALGLAMNAQGAWAQSHVDTHVRDTETSLSLTGWQGAEMQWYEALARAYFEWRVVSYFPKNALISGDGDMSHSYARYISSSLSGMEEPVIYKRHMDEGEAIIRLTILPAFGGPLVFRAHSNGPDNTLTLRISQAGEWGHIKNVETRVISFDHPAFTRILDRAFETRPCEVAHDDRFGFDGAVWAVEVKTADTYCADSVWAPGAGPWQDLAQEVFQYIEGDDEVLSTKWMIGMPLTKLEAQRLDDLNK